MITPHFHTAGVQHAERTDRLASWKGAPIEVVHTIRESAVRLGKVVDQPVRGETKAGSSEGIWRRIEAAKGLCEKTVSLPTKIHSQ